MKLNYSLFFVFFTTLLSAQVVTIPDAIFKSVLLSASPTVQIAKNLSGAYFKIDANSDGQIQQSEVNEVSELYLNAVGSSAYNMTSIEGISSFTNLVILNVQNNHIGTIDIEGLQYLTSLNCNNNDQYLYTLILKDLPSFTTLNCIYAGSNTSTPVYTFSNLPTLKYINFNGCRFYANTLDNITSLEEIHGYGGYKTTATNVNLSNKPNLKIVDLNNNSFATLTLMNNNIIETLNVNGSSLTTFDKSLFTNLKIVDFGWNKLHGLDFSNMTSLIQLYCDNASTSFTYDFTSLNVQGCTNLNKLICSRNVIQTLDLSNLSNLTFLDCSSNSDTFTHTGLQAINLLNCNSLKDVIASYNNYLTVLDLSCSSNYNQIRVENCNILQKINLKNGVNETGLTAGAFSYYSSPLLTLVGVDFGENFSFLPSTIQQSPYYNFTPNCSYNTIVGNVKFDIEGDGCQNNVGVRGIKMHYNCTSPDCYTFTDSNGNFYLYTQSNSVTLTPENNLFPLFDFGLTGPITVNFSTTNAVSYVNLCLAPAGTHNDIQVTLVPLHPAVPGMDSKYKLIYKNKGNQVQSGSINFTFDDSIMDLVVSDPVPTNSYTNAMQWDYTNLLPFETREINFTFNINSPTETPPVTIGTILNYTASILGSSIDENPDDNNCILNETVLNSYDPNNKICTDGKTIPLSMVGKYVHYVVNFENDGTAAARNIVVRDIIDTAKFDISSLNILSSSANVYARVTNVNQAEFIFENINLPFSSGSNTGYVAFEIKTKPTLTVGNTFSNTASIYFDYNYPIVTNTFVTTIQLLNTNEIGKENTLLTYPNPIKDLVFFKTEKYISKIEVYDIYGRILSSNAVENNTVNLSYLKTGNYILKLFTENGTTTTKIIKE